MQTRPNAPISWPSADGVWHTLRPMPGALEDPTLETAELTLVVLNGHIAWMGAAVDQVGVAIHQARCEQCASTIEMGQIAVDCG